MKKPCIHLICNAHLDPVWQWRWEEGCCETISTFRTAVEMLDTHDALIFNHNESLLYQWVERYDPSLFDAIRRLVKAGRWSISGGWHLQPDANLPGLESFFRHIAEGRRYFLERFGVRPAVAYNFDSFGHAGGLPQILRLFGYKMYIHMRPRPEELTLPSHLYRWRGVDGSEILALRIPVGFYHTERDNIEERLEEGVSLALELECDVPVFWGLGDHGGGATREDLEKIDAFIRKEKRVSILHSTPDKLYEALKDHGARAPVVEGDLQRVFTGCYTSLSRIKQRARRSLSGLVQTEALCTAAWWILGTEYPEEELEEAWKDHLFNDFHDILPGTCTEPAEQDALDLYGRASETFRRARLSAATAMNQGQGIASRAALPLTILNSNPALTRVPVEAEFMADYRPFWQGPRHMRLFKLAGGEITCQEEQPESLLPFNDWRRKVCFMADLPGLGAARFRLEAVEGHRQKAAAPSLADCEIDPASGLIRQIRTPSGDACLTGPLFQPIVVEDRGDSWGTGCGSYREEAGIFEPVEGSVRVIEEGPVRTITESVHRYGASRLIVHVMTYAEWPIIEVRMRFQWNEAHKRLKLAIPTVFEGGPLLCEIPGGIIERPGDGQEHVHGRWWMLGPPGQPGDEPPMALGVVHSGQHGLDYQNGEVRLSVLRSAAYCHWQGLDLAGRERKIMDQGIHSITLLAWLSDPQNLTEALPALADWLDAPPVVYAHLPFGEFGQGNVTSKSRASDTSMEGLLSIKPSGRPSGKPSGVRLTACKPSKDHKALIVRLHETAGREKTVSIFIHPGDRAAKIKFKPFQIRTVRFESSGAWKETDPFLES